MCVFSCCSFGYSRTILSIRKRLSLHGPASIREDIILNDVNNGVTMEESINNQDSLKIEDDQVGN
jgi:hypothetical protein